MKKISHLLMMAFVVLFTSCGAIKPKMSPEELKAMTTRQFEHDKELVFKSVVALLQSEDFMIDHTNNITGKIQASKEIRNKNAGSERVLLGNAIDSNTARVTFKIDEIDSELSEVQIKVYVTKKPSGGGYSIQNEGREEMIYSPEVYHSWFNNIRVTIRRQ